MKSKKFWNWSDVLNKDGVLEERILTLDGTIAEESWFDDDVTPELFKKELNKGSGPISVWINSPGGDCIAASQIYSALVDYPGKVTIKIDGIAASAASVIAMAGDEVLMARTASMMIHNPLTMAWGNKKDFEQAIQMLESVKESIINAYRKKTNLSRNEISELMDNETWMDATYAMKKGFADGVLERRTEPDDVNKSKSKNAMMFSRKAVAVALFEKIAPKVEPEPEPVMYKASDLLQEIKELKKTF